MLKKMVALITGGGGSLGLATAKRLIMDDYKVIILENPKAKNDIILKSLEDKRVEILNGDVSCAKDVEKVMKEIKSKFGYLNVLVNCAGVSKCRMIYNPNSRRISNVEEFEEILKVNVIGTFNVINQSIPLFMENTPNEDGLRGVVINTSGFYAYDGQIGQVGLAASGGAIASMTLPLCRDLASVGIRVMSIAPGVMESNLTSQMPPKIIKSLGNVTPNPKRIGHPEEYSLLVKSIIDNKFLNGETIRLDGGMRLYIF